MKTIKYLTKWGKSYSIHKSYQINEYLPNEVYFEIYWKVTSPGSVNSMESCQLWSKHWLYYQTLHGYISRGSRILYLACFLVLPQLLKGSKILWLHTEGSGFKGACKKRIVNGGGRLSAFDDYWGRAISQLKLPFLFFFAAHTVLQINKIPCPREPFWFGKTPIMNWPREYLKRCWAHVCRSSGAGGEADGKQLA